MLIVKIGNNIIVNEKIDYNKKQNQHNRNKSPNQNNQKKNIEKNDNSIKAIPKFKLNFKENINSVYSEKLRKLNEKKENLNSFMSKYINVSCETFISEIEDIEKSLNQKEEILSTEQNNFNNLLLNLEDVSKNDITKIIELNENQKGNQIDQNILKFISNHKNTFIEKIN
jgi:hypothetical protein